MRRLLQSKQMKMSHCLPLDNFKFNIKAGNYELKVSQCNQEHGKVPMNSVTCQSFSSCFYLFNFFCFLKWQGPLTWVWCFYMNNKFISTSRRIWIMYKHRRHVGGTSDTILSFNKKKRESNDHLGIRVGRHHICGFQIHPCVIQCSRHRTLFLFAKQHKHTHTYTHTLV